MARRYEVSLGDFRAGAGYDESHYRADARYGSRAIATAKLKGGAWNPFRQAEPTDAEWLKIKLDAMPKRKKTYSNKKYSKTAANKRLASRGFKKPVYKKKGTKRKRSSVSSSKPYKVGREWPPESMKVTMESRTNTTLDNYANDACTFAAIGVGTRLDGGLITKWDANDTAGTFLSRASGSKLNLPRNWVTYNQHYDRYRILKVTHTINFSQNIGVTNDYIIMHVKTSTNHRDIPLVHSCGVSLAASVATAAAQTHVENYRYTKQRRFASTPGHVDMVKYKNIRPFIYKDGFGQKTMGGKMNDDGSGIGAAVQFVTTTTASPPGLGGQDLFYVCERLAERGVWGAVNVEIQSKYTIEFFDRKAVATAVQSGVILGLP